VFDGFFDSCGAVEAEEAEGEVAGAVSEVGAAGVLSSGGVADVMRTVLDSPMLADVGVDRGGAFLAQAGDDESVFFGEPCAGEVEFLAADDGDRPCVGETDALGGGGPDGLPFDASVGAFFLVPWFLLEEW